MQMGLIALIGIFCFAFFSQAAVNRQMNYQGKLTNGSDVAVADANYDFVVRIYDSDSGGNCLWSARGSCVSPTARSVAVSKGIFSIMLGDTVAGDNALNLDFSSDTYYLGIKVGSDNEMIPRKRLGSVPQAINALNVVGDGYIDIGNTSPAQDAVNIDYNPASGANDAVEITYGSGGGTGTALKVTQSGSGDILNLFDGANEIFTVLNGGNVGIGTTNPGALLDIGSAGTTLGVIRLEGSTSGYAAIQPTAAAGNVTLTLPATTGTVALISHLHTQNTDTGTERHRLHHRGRLHHASPSTPPPLTIRSPSNREPTILWSLSPRTSPPAKPTLSPPAERSARRAPSARDTPPPTPTLIFPTPPLPPNRDISGTSTSVTTAHLPIISR